MTIRFFAGVACLALCAGLAGCTSAAPPAAATGTVTPAQPAVATYGCDGGSTILIESFGAAVRVTEGDAAPVELTASPPGQRSRYGLDGYALVLEEREALWMKARGAPLTCRR